MSDKSRQYASEMDLQREVESFTSKGWYLQISIEQGGFVHITAVGPKGVVYHTDQLAHESLESALMQLEMDIERTRVMAQELAPAHRERG